MIEDSGLWAWGAGDKGQLGPTSLEHRAEPTSIGGRERFATCFVMLAAGFYHSADLASDGAVWTWGAQNKGAGVPRGASGPGPRRRAGKIDADEDGTERRPLEDWHSDGGVRGVSHDVGDSRRLAVVLWVRKQGVIGAWGYGAQAGPDACFGVEGPDNGAKIVMVAAGERHCMEFVFIEGRQ